MDVFVERCPEDPRYASQVQHHSFQVRSPFRAVKGVANVKRYPANQTKGSSGNACQRLDHELPKVIGIVNECGGDSGGEALRERYDVAYWPPRVKASCVRHGGPDDTGLHKGIPEGRCDKPEGRKT